MSDRPRIAVTLGDVAGIGPELVARLIDDNEEASANGLRPRFLVTGHPAVLRRALELIGSPVEFAERSFEELEAAEDEVVCWNPGDDSAAEVPAGEIDARAGRAAYDALVGAVTAVKSGFADAIVTAPLNKAALHAAGLDYPGHTEILAEQCGVPEFAMMLYLPPGEVVRGPYGLGVAHVTLHTSIRSVPDLLTEAGVGEKIRLIDGFLRKAGCASPRIGVCALNPHAGEEGLFGDEEQRIIGPAVQAASMDVNVQGPIPADALMRRAAAGEFDGVVAMYHDQGHIALKLLGYDRAVNITLGLPIVRTSPSHGTAYDIAWKGSANPEGMRAALRMAMVLVIGP